MSERISERIGRFLLTNSDGSDQLHPLVLIDTDTGIHYLAADNVPDTRELSGLNMPKRTADELVFQHGHRLLRLAEMFRSAG